jgi:diguanylate cyclase (GGDEF)-like protein
VQTHRAAIDLIDRDHASFLAGLLDLDLPDQPGFSIVDHALAKGIPTIVFTGELEDELRDRIWSKKVVDYVPKEGIHNLGYVVSLIRRLDRNRSTKVLVVDDSGATRAHVRRLMQVHQYQVLVARDGIEALQVLAANPDIRLIIADYNMPNMDGFELTREVRASRSRHDLAIIGMSATADKTLSARFIKTGASDFINKPFSSEELYCRVAQNIELLEHIATIRDMSNKDYLTEIFNRRYFFDSGRKLHASSQRHQLDLALAMIDIDYFKRVNDNHGHAAGDAVLRMVAGVLRNRFRESDIVARYGGEEFCVLATNMDRKQAPRVFNDLRTTIADQQVVDNGTVIKITVSIGVCIGPLGSLDEMIRSADAALYQAKESGRNQTIVQPL